MRLRATLCLLAATGLLVITPLRAANAATSTTTSPGAWSVQRTAPGDGYLESVSCWSANGCMAVGERFKKWGQTLAERWNGNSWMLLKTPDPGNSQVEQRLAGVSCWSANGCIAIGQGNVNFVERWNGHSWKVQTITQTDSYTIGFNGVSCWSATGCIIVGADASKPYAERWTGSSWRSQKIPNPRGGGTLGSISCPSSRSCEAVGGAKNNSSPLAEMWNGRAWALQRTPTPRGGGELNEVSCWSASGCDAVGNAGNNKTFAERRASGSWSLQQTPNPGYTGKSGQWSELDGVSCWSSDGCIAVGTNHATYDLFGALWDGTSWALEDGASPQYDIVLRSVSCWSESGCIAVGDNAGGSGTVSERWSPQ